MIDAIRAGDQDALGAFRERERPRVFAYCAQACPPERVEQAAEAAFLDLVARARSGEPGTGAEILLTALRSAAAGRALVEAVGGVAPGEECQAMPELLAARANGELGDGGPLVREHLESCPVCSATAARLERAEQAYRQPGGEARAEAEPVAVREAAAAAPIAPEPAPAPPPPAPSPPAPIIVRRRSGGLVGAVRKAARSTLR